MNIQRIETIRVYNTCVNTPRYADQDGFLQRPGELAQSLLAQGITAMKVWPWDQFAPQLQVHAVTRPVNLFACLQLCAAVPNATTMETVRGFCEGYYRDVVLEPVPVQGGRAVLTGFGAGLDVTLRPEFLAQAGVVRRFSP